MDTTANNDTIGRREVIAARLRTARETAGLSQGQVARQMGIHRPTISEIEAGRRRVSAEEMATFSTLYGASIEWLSCAETENLDPAENRLQLAARELANMKPEDIDVLLNLLKTMRKGSRNSGGESQQ